jgi:hypothetical protein
MSLVKEIADPKREHYIGHWARVYYSFVTSCTDQWPPELFVPQSSAQTFHDKGEAARGLRCPKPCLPTGASPPAIRDSFNRHIVVTRLT